MIFGVRGALERRTGAFEFPPITCYFQAGFLVRSCTSFSAFAAARGEYLPNLREQEKVARRTMPTRTLPRVWETRDPSGRPQKPGPWRLSAAGGFFSIQQDSLRAGRFHTFSNFPQGASNSTGRSILGHG
jgi:hypothetical protein